MRPDVPLSTVLRRPESRGSRGSGRAVQPSGHAKGPAMLAAAGNHETMGTETRSGSCIKCRFLFL